MNNFLPNLLESNINYNDFIEQHSTAPTQNSEGCIKPFLDICKSLNKQSTKELKIDIEESFLNELDKYNCHIKCSTLEITEDIKINILKSLFEGYNQLELLEVLVPHPQRLSVLSNKPAYVAIYNKRKESINNNEILVLGALLGVIKKNYIDNSEDEYDIEKTPKLKKKKLINNNNLNESDIFPIILEPKPKIYFSSLENTQYILDCNNHISPAYFVQNIINPWNKINNLILNNQNENILIPNAKWHEIIINDKYPVYILTTIKDVELNSGDEIIADRGYLWLEETTKRLWKKMSLEFLKYLNDHQIQNSYKYIISLLKKKKKIENNFYYCEACGNKFIDNSKINFSNEYKNICNNCIIIFKRITSLPSKIREDDTPFNKLKPCDFCIKENKVDNINQFSNNTINYKCRVIKCHLGEDNDTDNISFKNQNIFKEARIIINCLEDALNKSEKRNYTLNKLNETRNKYPEEVERAIKFYEEYLTSIKLFEQRKKEQAPSLSSLITTTTTDEEEEEENDNDNKDIIEQKIKRRKRRKRRKRIIDDNIIENNIIVEEEDEEEEEEEEEEGEEEEEEDMYEEEDIYENTEEKKRNQLNYYKLLENKKKKENHKLEEDTPQNIARTLLQDEFDPEKRSMVYNTVSFNEANLIAKKLRPWPKGISWNSKRLTWSVRFWRNDGRTVVATSIPARKHGGVELAFKKALQLRKKSYMHVLTRKAEDLKKQYGENNNINWIPYSSNWLGKYNNETKIIFCDNEENMINSYKNVLNWLSDKGHIKSSYIIKNIEKTKNLNINNMSDYEDDNFRINNNSNSIKFLQPLPPGLIWARTTSRFFAVFKDPTSSGSNKKKRFKTFDPKKYGGIIEAHKAAEEFLETVEPWITQSNSTNFSTTGGGVGRRKTKNKRVNQKTVAKKKFILETDILPDDASGDCSLQNQENNSEIQNNLVRKKKNIF